MHRDGYVPVLSEPSACDDRGITPSYWLLRTRSEQTVEQPTLVVVDVTAHPRGRRAAHDADDVVLGAAPVVPEPFER